MAISLGPRRLLGASTLLGASQFLGQGNTNTAKDIEYELLFSTDDASATIPTWTFITADLRSFSVARGRASELQEMDAGTATITLDNRGREYDPANTSGPFTPNLRPMNRVWLRMRFNGLTHDVFKGYVESYEQQYPGTVDAVTVVKATDEFKVLSLANLPVSSPPRDTYTDLVQSDSPVAYWRMNNSASDFKLDPVIGPTLNLIAAGSSVFSGNWGAITGERAEPATCIGLGSATEFTSGDLGVAETPDMSARAEFALECWLKTDTLAFGYVIYGPTTSGTVRQYTLTMGASGELEVKVRSSSGPSTVTATSAAGTVALGTGASGLNGPWCHVVATITGGNLRLYVNAVQVASAAWAGLIDTNVLTAGLSQFSLGYTGNTANRMYLDEVAVYSYGLAADRVLAHYVAGQYGFPRSKPAGIDDGPQYAHQRVIRALDAVSNDAPRVIRDGTREMNATFMHGQPPLDELRNATSAEAIDAMLFIANDGTLTFLDSAHRASSPWDTVQATFGDGGGSELDYMDIQVDYSDSFIANEWNVTRDSGTTTATASDATSISRFFKRSQSLPALNLLNDSDTTTIAAAMLAKYKDPATRVTSLSPKTMNTTVLDTVFQLELGDRIRVLLTPPGGGPRVDQTLFIQSITIDATPQAVYPDVKLGVSPV